MVDGTSDAAIGVRGVRGGHSAGRVLSSAVSDGGSVGMTSRAGGNRRLATPVTDRTAVVSAVTAVDASAACVAATAVVGTAVGALSTGETVGVG